MASHTGHLEKPGRTLVSLRKPHFPAAGFNALPYRAAAIILMIATVWVLVFMLALAPSGEQQVAIYTAGPVFPTLAECIEVASQASQATGCVEIMVGHRD